MKGKRKLKKEILKWTLRRHRLENGDYDLIPPEYNPNEEHNSKTEIVEFIDGVISGLSIAYRKYEGENLMRMGTHIHGGGNIILSILEDELDVEFTLWEGKKIAKKVLNNEDSPLIKPLKGVWDNEEDDVWDEYD